MKRIVILISGRGSNMVSLAQACRDEHWPAEVVAVISNRPGAGGLVRAAEMGLATGVVDHRAFADRPAFDADLAAAIDAHAPDWLVLAGFMRILTADFVRRYEGRLINIHPSLLPAFTGLHTHQRALDAGCKLAGATVHLVTPELDHGPIVAQAVVPVLPGDTESSLGERVLAAEHLLFPRALRWCVEGSIAVRDGVVSQTRGEPQFILCN